jgi:DNA-binding IclR family transcriptional regulator
MASAPVVQSVERAFSVLHSVAAGTNGLTAIADGVGLPKSTVSRLLQTLEELEAVERLHGPRWRIGRGVVALASGASGVASLVAVARPYLADLVRDVGEDAGLSVADGFEVLYVDQVEADNPVQVRDWTGTRAPMHAVPSGIVLLADWPAAAVEAYVAHGLARLTPRTLATAGVLASRLAEAREHGYAWGREEFAEGISSVAAAIRDHRGRAVGAVHVPSYRFPLDGDGEQVAARVVAAAEAIGARLAAGVPAGGRG